MKILNMKTKIMFSVYLAYLTRKFRSPFIAEVILFLIFSAILLVFVSVPSVVSNMLASGNFYEYLLAAFSQTDIMVKTILILAAITAALFVKNITLQTVSFFKERFV